MSITKKHISEDIARIARNLSVAAAPSPFEQDPLLEYQALQARVQAAVVEFNVLKAQVEASNI